MKYEIIYRIIQKLKSNPNLMRKAKIVAVIGVFCFLLMGGLVIWAGVSAFNFVATQAQQIIQKPEVKAIATTDWDQQGSQPQDANSVASSAQDLAQIEKVKTGIQNLPIINQPLGCWVSAQNLLVVETWLSRPVVENIQNVITACLGNVFDSMPTICIGPDCKK